MQPTSKRWVFSVSSGLMSVVTIQYASKIALQNVSLRYAKDQIEFVALKDVNLSILAGEFVSIIGPSAGKVPYLVCSLV